MSVGIDIIATESLSFSEKTADMVPIEVGADEKAEFDAVLNAPDEMGAKNIADVPSIGDTVLQGLSDANSSINGQFGDLQALSSSDKLDVQELMKIQFSLAKISVHSELINKTVTQITQNVDTLMKSQ